MRVIHSWARTFFRDPLKRGRESSTILLELDQKKESAPTGVRTLFTPQAMLQRVSSSASHVLA